MKVNSFSLGRWARALTCTGICLFTTAACSSLVTQATSGLSANLSAAILNQDDPETVRDGAPAFLLMLDSFVEGSPDDPGSLATAAELYAAYGVLFVEDTERAGRLTQRAKNYAERALCASSDASCGLQDLRYPDYTNRLEAVSRDDIDYLYTYSLAWFAFVKVHSSDMGALAKLPYAEAALRRVRALDAAYREADVDHYLGVLSTIRPPALGGNFDAGKQYFERAIELTSGRNLAAQVDYARYYARTLYERDLHDRLLQDVLEADPHQPGLTLFNVLAQREARALLASADDYF